MRNQVATINERLREAMEYRGFRQRDIVEKTGFSKSLVNQYVHGRVKSIKSENVHIFARALGVSEAWLMGLDVDMFAQASKDEFAMDEKRFEELKMLDGEKRNAVYMFIDFLFNQK